MRLGKVRACAHRLPEAGHRLRQHPLVDQHDAQDVVRIGEIGLQAHGRVQVIASQIVPARPSRDEPEKIERVGLAAIRLHDLPANLLRLLQVARLVVFPGHLDRLLGSKTAAIALEDPSWENVFCHGHVDRSAYSGPS